VCRRDADDLWRRPGRSRFFNTMSVESFR